jgi:hypothetical protein
MFVKGGVLAKIFSEGAEQRPVSEGMFVKGVCL